MRDRENPFVIETVCTQPDSHMPDGMPTAVKS